MQTFGTESLDDRLVDSIKCSVGTHMLTGSGYRLVKQRTADITIEFDEEVLFETGQDVGPSGRRMGWKKWFVARS
jgi:hypothetical protein